MFFTDTLQRLQRTASQFVRNHPWQTLVLATASFATIVNAANSDSIEGLDSFACMQYLMLKIYCEQGLGNSCADLAEASSRMTPELIEQCQTQTFKLGL